ncbi:glycosyltransferase family 2 protein [Terrabacter sp. C0L_2]|uniref:glycosyltransferase family 2 protein n=1 Tax=Terrabacter sp. C0L_2 TaxID=3108389 RepID=UPI002ED05DC3|nr:glycosyltransferase family A protein [Terrabacter sp. C0L_2]
MSGAEADPGESQEARDGLPDATAETAVGAGTLDYDVVVPSHGRHPDLLLAAVDSVLAQSCPPARVLVVMDGNAEASRLLARARPQVQVLEVEEPRGAAHARQVGIDHATATWVAFLDDDDLWHPAKQERVATWVSARPGCRAVRSGFWTFTEPASGVAHVGTLAVELVGSTVDELVAAAATAVPRNDLGYLDIDGDSLALMLERNRGVIGSSVVRRDLLQSLPAVPAGLRPGDDHALLTLVASRTEWQLMDERLLFYRAHAAQDTRDAAGDAMADLVRARITLWDLVGDVAPRPLESYGPVYRGEVRQMAWSLVSEGRVSAALSGYRAAARLLPRRRDRLLVLVPEPVAWRWRHRRPRGPWRPASGRRPPG